MAYVVVQCITVSSPASTAVKSFYVTSVLTTEWYSDSGSNKESHLHFAAKVISSLGVRLVCKPYY